MRIIVESLIKFELLHLFAVLYLHILRYAIGCELLTKEIVVGKFIFLLLLSQ